MKRFSSLCILALTLVFVTLSDGQEVPPEWNSFQAQYGHDFLVQWDERTGKAATILGVVQPMDLMQQLNLNALQTKIDAVRLASGFLDEQQALFGVNSADFGNITVRTIASTRLGRLYKVKFRQIYQGTPVVNTRAILFLNSKGDILSTVVNAYPDIVLDTTPAIPAVQAKNTALSVVPERVDNRPFQEGAMKQEPVQLIVVPKAVGNQVEFHLAWRMVNVTDGGPVEVMVDAKDGEILSQRRLALEYRNKGDVQFAYYQDPSTGTNLNPAQVWDGLNVTIYNSSGATVASQSADASDSNYDITWSGAYSNYWLYFLAEDSYSKVYLWKEFFPSSNFEYDIGSRLSTTPPVSPSFSPTGGIYDRALINVKHQCAQMHAFFQGIDSSYNKSKVTVQVFDSLDPSGENNLGSTFSETYFELYGSTVNNYSGSTSPDVIRHEYTHTVVTDIYKDYWWESSLDNDLEELSMNEGFAEYYAARSLGDDPAQTSPAYADPAILEPMFAENIDTSGVQNWSAFSCNATEHTNGRILSGTMWDVAKGSQNPKPVNPTSGWDEIMWIVLNQEPRDYAAWRDELEYWALQWGGSSYQSFAWQICDQHGLPSRYHAPFYVDPGCQ